jgi:mono/diheme cytochrome c family protein
MNTRKQVLIMTVLLLAMLIIVGAYAAWYPYRATDAQEDFDDKTADRGAFLFARYCRLCHGDVGEGGSLGARLPAAPALHRPDLQGFIDSKATVASDIDSTSTTVRVSDGSRFKTPQTILVDDERMDLKGVDGNNLEVERAAGHSEAIGHTSGSPVLILDASVLKDKMKLITNTITCGRVGTAMPAWAQSQGGALSDEQIRQLMTMITQSRWDLVKEHVDIEDLVHAHLVQDVSEDTFSIFVSDVSVFTEGEYIRIGEERLHVTGVPKLPTDSQGKLPKDKSGVISVERGVKGTTPLEHTVEEPIYRFPETAPPSINQASCGQTAQPAAPAGTPELVEPFEGQTVQVVAQNIAFDLKEIRARTGGKIRVRLDNRDQATEHNIAFYKSSSDLSAVSPGSIGTKFPGPGVDDTVFDVPAGGTYFFRCDVHPTIMTGSFIVQ